MRTRILIRRYLLDAIDALAGRRGRSAFLVQAARREVKRLRMLKALDLAAGSWKNEHHPELSKGAARWVEKLRRGNEARLRRMTRS